MNTHVLGANWRGLVIPGAILALWAATVWSEFGNPHIFVPLGAIAATAATLTGDGTLTAAVAGTLGRMAAGFALGAAAGLALGLVLGLSRPVGRAVTPTFNAVRQIAIFAWMPLLTAWLGLGGTAMIALIALGAFFPMVVNVEAGCRNVPASWLEVGRVLEFDRWRTIRRIVLPAAAPAIFAGLELALASAWLSTIGAEYLIAAGDGLGVLLAAARALGQMDVVIVGIVLLGLIGFSLNLLLAHVSRRTFRWRLDPH